MKKNFTMLVALFAIVHFSYSQNIFPTPSGKVGIGTATPAQLLEVSGGYSLLNGLRVSGADNANSIYSNADIGITTAGGAVGLHILTNGTQYFTGGNIGIGTTSPDRSLVISGTTGGGAGDNAFHGTIRLDDATALAADNGAGVTFGYTYTGTSQTYGPFIRGYKSTATDSEVGGGLKLGVRGDSGNPFTALTINKAGNVGIGITSPNAKLEISGYTGQNVLRLTNTTDGGQTTGDPIGRIEFYTTDADGPHVGATMTAINEETFGRNTGLAFGTQVIGGPVTERMRINNTGNVGIGTTTPDAKLAVNGTIHTKEVKVDLTGWPDYVFKPAYVLPALSAVKTYIDKYQHLPDMPSAAEVAKDGVKLGELNKLLTKKVEELTLYLIQLKTETDKQNKLQQELINKLKRRVIIITKASKKN